MSFTVRLYHSHKPKCYHPYLLPLISPDPLTSLDHSNAAKARPWLPNLIVINSHSFCFLASERLPLRPLPSDLCAVRKAKWATCRDHKEENQGALADSLCCVLFPPPAKCSHSSDLRWVQQKNHPAIWQNHQRK